MTSKSLYSAEQDSILHMFITKRLILIALCAISLIAYYPVRTLLMLSRLMEGHRSYMYAGGDSSFGTFLSASELAPYLLLLLGVYAGIEGFAWIFSKQKIDFYEALPISRKKNFNKIYLSGVLIFGGVYLISMLLTLVIAAFAGMLNGAAMSCALFALLRDVSIFLSAYGIAILACMLVGSLFYAVCMSGFMLVIGAAVSLMLRKYMQIYFSTFADGYTAIPAPLNLPWHIERLSRIGNGRVYENLMMEFSGLRLLSDGLPHFATLFGVAVLTFVLACVLFQKRKVENAGATVIHYPVQVIVKFLAAIVGGMTLGVLVEDAFGHDSFVYLAVVVLGITGLICIIMEMLYKRSVRSGLMSLLHVPVVMAITYILLLFFRLDICSYDRFIPTSDKVESYALMTNGSMLGTSYTADYDSFLTDESYALRGLDNFAEKYMYLTNVSDMEVLAQSVLTATDERELEDEVYTDENFYDCVVLYRLRSGRKVYRRMQIPCSTDERLLAAVIDTDEYRYGTYQIFHADSMVELFDNKESSMTYDSGYSYLSTASAGKVEEFLRCYAEDMKGLTFKEQRNTQMAGIVGLSREMVDDYRFVYLPVYQSFEKTKDLMRSYDIYSETDPDDLEVKRISVSRYLLDEAGEEIYDWLEHEYTEPAQIEAIRKCSVYDALLSPWFNRNLLEKDYYINEYAFDTAGRTDVSFTFAQRSLLKDKIPDFIRKDLEDESEADGFHPLSEADAYKADNTGR